MLSLNRKSHNHGSIPQRRQVANVKAKRPEWKVIEGAEEIEATALGGEGKQIILKIYTHRQFQCYCYLNEIFSIDRRKSTMLSSSMKSALC